MRRRAPKKPVFSELAATLSAKLRPPFGIALGSPHEVAELAASLPAGDTTCFQMDLHQAERLREELGSKAAVFTAPDLWDLPERVQTLLYPVPYGGERSLKIDMIEQAFHALRPQGTFIVLSPYDKDDLFPPALKKVFGRVHTPMSGQNKVLWCVRDKDRERRRHEMTFQVNAGDGQSLRFLSRPGTFSYGRFDDGARALVETMDVQPGEHVLDLGCGCGTNGLFAARKVGPEGSVTFVDSNLRALALTELNAKALGVTNYTTVASSTLTELPKKSFDLVLANPPYFAQLTIAKHFIECARRVLKRGGRLCLVTKQGDHVGPEVAELFGPTEAIERRGYVILRATV